MQRKIHGTVISSAIERAILRPAKAVPPPDDPGDSGTARGSISRTSAAGTDALSPRVGPYTGAGIPPLPRLFFILRSDGPADFGSATDSTYDDGSHRISPVVLGGFQIADAVDAVADVDEAFPYRVRR